MQITTRKAKKGMSICYYCDGVLVLKEEETIVIPKDGIQYAYLMEYSRCEHCKEDVILSNSILKNDIRRDKAQKEAQVTYRMNKWLSSK